MKPSSVRNKSLIFDLLRNIKYPLNTTSKYSNAKSNLTGNPNPATTNSPKTGWVDRFTEYIHEPLPMTSKDQQNLAESLNKQLIKQLKEKSSIAPVNDHFIDLFTGLNTLTIGPERHSISSQNEQQKLKLISECTSNNTLMEYFTELFYTNTLSVDTVLETIRHPKFTDVSTVDKLLFGSGYPNKWPISTSHYIRLQISNKYWKLKEYNKAKSIVIDLYHSTWLPALENDLLSKDSMRGLMQALKAFERDDLILKTFESWKNDDLSSSKFDSLPILKLWSQCFSINRYLSQISEVGAQYYKVRNDDFSYTVYKCLHVYSLLPASKLTTELKKTINKAVNILQRKRHTVNILVIMSDVTGILYKSDCAAEAKTMSDLLLPFIKEQMKSSDSQSRERISTALALQKLISNDAHQAKISEQLATKIPSEALLQSSIH